MYFEKMHTSCVCVHRYTYYIRIISILYTHIYKNITELRPTNHQKRDSLDRIVDSKLGISSFMAVSAETQ